MKGNSRRDRIFATVSWFIVVALLFSAFSVATVPPSGAGPVAQLLTVMGAQIFYGVLYVGEAIVLAYSKLFNRKRLRKHTLLVIYLTGFFTSLLTLTIVGWTPGLIDNLAISVTAAGCWLYWTFKNEYISNQEYRAYRGEPKD